jgi:hypothetical protein
MKMTFIFLVFHPPGKVPKEEDSGWSPEPSLEMETRKELHTVMENEIPDAHPTLIHL